MSNLKLNPKLVIIDYFDQVVNQIDIQTELCLFKNNLNQSEISSCNLNRAKLIKEIRHIERENLNKSLPSFVLNFDDETIESIYRQFFEQNFCFYLNIQNIPYLGVLVVTDFYLSKQQINQLL